MDTPKILQAWIPNWEARWHELAVETRLKRSSPEELSKAVLGLEAPTHVASLTVWGAGTLEFIVLDLATQSEVLTRDDEFTTQEELRRLLDDCADSFCGFIR